MLLWSFFLFLLTVEKKVMYTMITSTSSPNYLGVFTAIIAAFGALTGAYFSYQSLNNSRKTLEQQKILGEQSIDANIIANARIKWIQEVRKLASEIYSKLDLYQKSFQSKEPYDLSNMMIKLNSLLLFFGDDSKNSNSEDRDSKDSNCKDNDSKNTNPRINDGQNKQIIDMIFEIKEKLKSLYGTQQSIIHAENTIKETKWYEYDQYMYITTDTSTDNEKYLDELYKNSEEKERDKEKFDYYTKQIDSYKEDFNSESSELEALTFNFSNILRKYLKDEWKEITIVKK